MAFFSSNIISFLFFTTLSLSLQIHARDSQFFSKVTHANTNNIGKEMELIPNKQEPLNKPSEQEPMFIPETDHNSYGLYGHETGQFPPTTTTYQPYKTQSSEDAYNTNLNDFNKDDTYGENQNELGNSKYRQVYNSLSNQKENNQKYHYSNNGANDRYYYYNNNNAASSRNYGEREGMSDTRFMEGGKYFYNPNFYADSTRGPKSKSLENKMGYFGRPNLHPQSYKNSNAFEGYQNQEFEDKRDDFEP